MKILAFFLLSGALAAQTALTQEEPQVVPADNKGHQLCRVGDGSYKPCHPLPCKPWEKSEVNLNINQAVVCLTAPNPKPHLDPKKASDAPDWPKIVSAHIVLDSVQAAEQDHPVPTCTPQSTTTCMDPTLRHITGRLYGLGKESCEYLEGVTCKQLPYQDAGKEYWVPIGKPVFVDETPSQSSPPEASGEGETHVTHIPHPEELFCDTFSKNDPRYITCLMNEGLPQEIKEKPDALWTFKLCTEKGETDCINTRSIGGVMGAIGLIPDAMEPHTQSRTYLKLQSGQEINYVQWDKEAATIFSPNGGFTCESIYSDPNMKNPKMIIICEVKSESGTVAPK